MNVYTDSLALAARKALHDVYVLEREITAEEIDWINKQGRGMESLAEALLRLAGIDYDWFAVREWETRRHELAVLLGTEVPTKSKPEVIPAWIEDRCDGVGPHYGSEIRKLPHGTDGNILVCHACFDREMSCRKEEYRANWDKLDIFMRQPEGE